MKELFAKLKAHLTGEKLKHNLKKALQFIANPRLILCFLAGWMITNGWSYIMFGIGTYLEIPWMIAVSGAYLAFLWLPISPEKIVTCAIALVLVRWLFPKHQKALAAQLKEIFPPKQSKHAKEEPTHPPTQTTNDTPPHNDRSNGL